ncbi:MAG: hypothetical protein KC589_02690 [Nanoarchaeota archaeon]|nr:hypothetical protein [Nanoarchaeota archaeon]
MTTKLLTENMINDYLQDFSKTLHNIYGTLLGIQTSIENINRRVNKIEESYDSVVLLDSINKRLAFIQNIVQSNSVEHVQNNGFQKC